MKTKYIVTVMIDANGEMMKDDFFCCDYSVNDHGLLCLVHARPTSSDKTSEMIAFANGCWVQFAAEELKDDDNA